MRTLSANLADKANRRYQGGDFHDLDPTNPRDAKNMLATGQGRKIATIVAQELLLQSDKPGGGWLPTARLSAPLPVLLAMETLGAVERADDNTERQTVAYRFRLTDKILDAAMKARGEK